MKLRTYFALIFLGIFGNSQAATVGTLPNPAEVTLGETFSIDIIATGFDVVLDGGGLNIHYDPSVLRLNDVSVDTDVWDPDMSWVNGGIDNSNGEVTGIIFNSFDDVTGDFHIATLDFTATGLWMSPIELSQYDLNPFASGGAMTPVILENGAINVSPVPLPATAWLMFSGLGLLMGWGRQRIASRGSNKVC